MGRRKGSKNKNTTNMKKGNTTTRKSVAKKSFSNDMLGGLLVVIGLVLLVFLMFDNIGVLPEAMKSIMKGFFGFSAYILPVSLIIIGIYSIMSEKSIVISNEIKKSFLIMTLFSATLYSYATSDVSGFFNNVVKGLIDSYNLSVTGSNIAGVCGTLITSIIASFSGMVATRVIFTCITFIALLCVFNISFKEFFIIVNNICVGFCNMILSAFGILFRDDNVEDDDIEDDRIKEQERIRINDIMKEKANVNASENVKVDRAEQLVFDINKLGVEPSREEVEGKQKRDEFFKLQKEQKEDKSIKEVLTLSHTNHVEQDNYIFPSIELLNMPEVSEVFDKKAIEKVALKLQKTLASFGVEAKVTNITKGPTVTRYELTPSTGVKVSKIVNLSDDIALNLAAKSIRIEAPIPGRAAVGIEVPNAVSESVFLREVIESDTFKQHKSKLAFALGKDAAGDIVVSDIAKMPHVLIAGATGSGKSVCINSLIISLLYKAKPSEVKMMLIDPKMVELSGYNGIPHLLIPVVTEPKKAAGALNWAVQEMVNRYTLFASKNVKDIKGYNKIMEKEEGIKLPQIVIIVDELADLMMVAPNDVEDAICRLAQMARAAGMHLVIATQRPSVDVITGIIKANIPSRIACTVSSQVDSRTILDMAGAEKLLGKGDMLYYPVGQTKPLRVQGTFISEEEIESIVDEIKANSTEATYSDEIIKSIENANLKTKGMNNKAPETADVEESEDPILNEAIDLAMDIGQASASMFQRKFKIGYSRAGRIIDQMEERGLISGYDGSKPRKLLISKEEWQELKFGSAASSSKEDVESEAPVTDAILNDTIEVMKNNSDYPKTSSRIDVEL